MSETIQSGFGFIAFGAAAMSYVLYSPDGEPQLLRAIMGILCSAMSGFWLLVCIRSIIREELARKESTVRQDWRDLHSEECTALPALLDYVKKMEEEIARWRACYEAGRSLSSVTDRGYKLTVTIEATAPAAAYGYCGKGSTVAEAVRSLGEMMKEKTSKDAK